MPTISVDLNLYMPSMAQLYQEYDILKDHGFIHDVATISKDGSPFLQITRNEVI